MVDQDSGRGETDMGRGKLGPLGSPQGQLPSTVYCIPILTPPSGCAIVCPSAGGCNTPVTNPVSVARFCWPYRVDYFQVNPMGWTFCLLGQVGAPRLDNGCAVCRV